jgi:predicted transcriptional regulator
MVKVVLSISLDDEIYKKLEKEAKRRNVSKSKLVEEALKEYLENK